MFSLQKYFQFTKIVPASKKKTLLSAIIFEKNTSSYQKMLLVCKKIPFYSLESKIIFKNYDTKSILTKPFLGYFS